MNYIKKIAIVTGANSGIGKEVAKQMTQRNVHVILACRDKEKGRKAERDIGKNSKFFYCDLSSFDSIKKFSEKIKLEYDHIDYLYNNAGVFLPPYNTTKEGYELTYGINYLSYFYLTLSLIEFMNNIKGSRIINISSIASFEVKELNLEHYKKYQKFSKKFNKMKVYQDSNIMRSMFTHELDNRLKQKGYDTIAVSGHPGIVLTNIQRHSILMKIIIILFNLHHNIKKGAAPLVKACLDSTIKRKDFVGLDTLKQYKGKPMVLTHSNKLVFNNELRKKLWDHSVNQTQKDL